MSTQITGNYSKKEDEKSAAGDTKSKLLNSEEAKKKNKITKETIALTNQLKVENSKFEEKQPKVSTEKKIVLNSKISQLQEATEEYKKKVRIENEKLTKLQDEVKKLEEALQMQRKEQLDTFKKTDPRFGKGSKQEKGSTHAEHSDSTTEDLNRRIKILDHQLEKQTQKLSQTKAHNKQLKDSIDALRKERLIFDKIYRNLEKELLDKKNALNKIIEQAETAYLNRENALAHIQKTKEEVEEKKASYNKKWEDLQSIIQNEISKNETNTKKEKDATITTQEKATKNITDLKNEEDKIKKEISANEEKIKAYKEAFEKIKQETKINDINEIAAHFTDTDQHNNSLNQCVIELLKELQDLESQIQDTKTKISHYNGENTENEVMRNNAKAELEAKIKSTEEQIEKNKKKYSETIKTVNALKIGIKSLYESIVTEQAPKEEMGLEGEITEENMIQYLGVIEKRTNEILQLYKCCKDKAGYDSYSKLAKQKPKEITNNGLKIAEIVKGIESSSKIVIENNKEESYFSSPDVLRNKIIKEHNEHKQTQQKQ